MRSDDEPDRLLGQKILVIVGLGLVLLATSGASFYSSRRLKEPVVLGPGVTTVKKLRTTSSRCAERPTTANVYFLEGKAAGRDDPRARRVASGGAGRPPDGRGSSPRTPSSRRAG